jgi:TonB family protein
MQPVPEQFTNAPEINGQERRLRVRRSPAALTYVTLGENNGGILANISETGMSVTAGEPLRESVFSRVGFKLPQSDRLIESRAEVVWTSESKKEAGLRFVDMREETREEIRKWISPPRRNGQKVERPAESTPNVESEGHPRAAANTDIPPDVKPGEKSNRHAPDVELRDKPRGLAPTAYAPEASATQTSAGESSEAQEAAPPERSETPRLSETDLLERIAASESGPKSWALTAAQRAEFERLFPSETRRHRPPEPAARSEPVIEPAAAPSFVAPIAPQQPVAAEVDEHRAAPSASARRAPDVAAEVTDPAQMWRATPATASPPRMPAQSLWDAPPPMLEPIIGRGFGSSYAAQAADSADESRPRSLWSTAMLILLIVAGFFALGFVAGPDLVRNWPIMEDVRQIVHDKLNHVKAVAMKGSSAAPPASLNAPAPTPNTTTNDQTVAPAQPAPSAPSAAPIAPDTAASPAGNAAPEVNAPSASAPPNALVPSGTAPHDTAAGDATPSSTASNDKTGKSSEANAAPPGMTGSAPAPAAKERHSAPLESASRAPETRTPVSRTTAKERPVEKPHTPPEVKAAPSAAVNTPREVAPPLTASARAPESSMPPTTNSTARPTNSMPDTSTSGGSTPSKSAPPTRAGESAANPKTPPASYFPVVAPAAGNVPRLIELPEEKVIDTAAVVIHSHQIVFVPAEPGPESSHKLEKLQIGDRTTKLAPTYPPQAAQKGMGGTVHLRATIGQDGNVQDVRPINGPIILIPAAVEAIRQWQYQPSLLDQQPIEMQEDFTIEFRPLGVQARQ